MPLLRVCNPRAELGQRHPAIPVPGAVHAVHDAPVSRSGRTSVSGPAHPGSRLLDARDTTPYRTENAVPAGKSGGGACQSQDHSHRRAPPSQPVLGSQRRYCGWRCALQLAGLGEGPMTIQGPTLHFGPTSQPCACSISHLKEPGGDGGQRVTRRPSPADTPSQGSL